MNVAYAVVAGGLHPRQNLHAVNDERVKEVDNYPGVAVGGGGVEELVLRLVAIVQIFGTPARRLIW